MNDAKIRLAQPGDECGIHDAHMRSIREICIKDHGEEEIRGWGYRPLGNRWIEPIKNGNVWVVEYKNNIHGLAHIRIFSENTEPKAHLHALYLTPEVLHQGFGYKLTILMLERARNSGAKSVTLESSITAHGFYKRLGFNDRGPMFRQDIGGHPVSAYPMILNFE